MTRRGLVQEEWPSVNTEPILAVHLSYLGDLPINILNSGRLEENADVKRLSCQRCVIASLRATLSVNRKAHDM